MGELEIVRIEDSSFALPTAYDVPAWMVPEFAPTTGEIALAFSALAVRAADGQQVVIDPWLADDNPRAQPDAAEHVEGLLDQLAAAGFPADDVALVVNTHIDGVGWNTRPDGAGGWVPTFPNARYVYPAAELASVDRGDPVYGGDEVGVLRAAGLVDAVAAPAAVAPGVEVVDAPGHNPGHFAVRIEAGDDLAIVPGHLVLSPIQVDDPAFDVGDADLAVATATRRSILGELAAREGLLLTTLVGGPGGGRVQADGDGYALRADHLT